MENNYFKYPKTFHCPESKPNAHGNDRVHDNLDFFKNKEVVITLKCDGENESLYKDKIHARSIDSGYHPSRTWLKAFHSTFSYKFPNNINRICGENLQGKHAIHYTNLPTYFLVFGIYNHNNECLSWDDTSNICNDLGLTTVPVLYRGIWSEDRARSCYTGRSIINGNDSGESEGYVVRIADKFDYNDFAINTYKWVRPFHVSGDEHWTKKYTPNTLMKY